MINIIALIIVAAIVGILLMNRGLTKDIEIEY